MDAGRQRSPSRWSHQQQARGHHVHRGGGPFPLPLAVGHAAADADVHALALTGEVFEHLPHRDGAAMNERHVDEIAPRADPGNRSRAVALPHQAYAERGDADDQRISSQAVEISPPGGPTALRTLTTQEPFVAEPANASVSTT